MALKKNFKVDIKKKYRTILEISTAISILLMILAFKFFPRIEIEGQEFEIMQELLKVEDIINTRQDNLPPPPPKPPIPIEAPDDDEVIDIPIENSELIESDNVPPPPPPNVNNEDSEKNFIFIVVEEIPEPIGGIKAIQEKIIYPEIAKRAGVQGQVLVRAIVDEDGLVQKAEILKGIGAGCDEAAMDAVMQTKFKPGKQRGKSVKAQVSIPILFKLN